MWGKLLLASMQINPCNLSCTCSLSPSDELSVGFVYTFSVTDPDERETFYLTVPEDDSSLKFEFDIRNNPHNQEVLVQLFLGRGELQCIYSSC